MIHAYLNLSFFRAFSPKPFTLKERLQAFPKANLPLQQEVRIHWNRYQIPFIIAKTDHDLAFVLGLVHLHLRETEINLLKRAAQGRLAEMFGPLATRLDELLRMLDFGRAAKQWQAQLPESTRLWLESFLNGMNHYQAVRPTKPPEFPLLGLKPEPWQFADLFAMARLAGADVNWLMYFTLLPERKKSSWPWVWRRAKEAGLDSVPSFSKEEAKILKMLLQHGRSGSNSMVIGAPKSENNSAMIASDPHLGVLLPNAWILLGMQSPTYHAVGLMPAGLPVMGIGRNPHVAWGGTNLRALASDLFDVSTLDDHAFTTDTTTIKRRFWTSKTITRRNTPFGPVISDAKIFPAPQETLALSWVGHEATDEFTALLQAMKAKDSQTFFEAFERFGVSAQHMMFADDLGNIGEILAATLPKRQETLYPDLVRDATDPAMHWQGFYAAFDLPMVWNPKKGVLASANNCPTESDLFIGLFFSDSDRITRLYECLDKPCITLEDLKRVQQDVCSGKAALLATALAKLCREEGFDDVEILLLEKWQGEYSKDSEGAWIFESFLCFLVPAVYRDGKKEATAFLTQWGFIAKYLIPDLLALDENDRKRLLQEALTFVKKQRRRFKTWGEVHHLDVSHYLGMLPVLGRFFRYGRFSVGGSRETPMKTAHRLVKGPHGTDYGSQARHVSDMGDLDENYFLIFGGNDGWLGSENFADQVPLWQQGAYIRMPLRLQSINQDFPIAMRLNP